MTPTQMLMETVKTYRCAQDDLFEWHNRWFVPGVHVIVDNDWKGGPGIIIWSDRPPAPDHVTVRHPDGKEIVHRIETVRVVGGPIENLEERKE